MRTHSKGAYVLAGTDSESSLSSDSEMDYEMAPSRPATPPPGAARPQASTILVDAASVAPGPPRAPTVEQNMAYAAFREESSSRGAADGHG